MKFDVDDKNRCRLVCVKFYLNRCRFAVAVAKCLGGSLFGTQCTDGVRSFVPGRPCSSRVQGRRRRGGGGGGDDFKVELEKSQLNDVVGVADEPVEDAGDVGRVDAREVGRVESGRLRTRRTVLVRHPVALCSPRVHRNSNTHTHTHPFNGPFPGLPGSAGTRKVSGFY